jgi:glucokinase
MSEYVFSVDVGGSKILSALVARDGKVVAEELEQTAALDKFDAVLRQIRMAYQALVKRAEAGPDSRPLAVSLAIAGAIDLNNGVVTESPNLPQWQDVPLRSMVEEALGLQTFMINDANAAALGEHTHGAGRGTRNMVFITVSTGIGGGLIINGDLYQGCNGAAGEIGHMVIDVDGPLCGCGNYGCLEALASGTAIARDAADRIALGTYSSIPKFTNSGGTITAAAVAAAAKQGDPLANEIVSRAAHYLGMGLVSVVNVFNPEMVVIGGGVAQMGDMLLNPARQVVRENAFRIAADAAQIVQAQLGARAGVVGASTYAWRQLKRSKRRTDVSSGN